MGWYKLGKAWEDMSNKERAEQTIRDIKRRQAIRKKAAYDVKALKIESVIKSSAKRRSVKNRGCRSLN